MSTMEAQLSCLHTLDIAILKAITHCHYLIPGAISDTLNVIILPRFN